MEAGHGITDIFTSQPFWTHMQIENFTLIPNADGKPLAYLRHLSSETPNWKTIPGLCNMSLLLSMENGKPQIICSGLHPKQSIDKVPFYSARDGKYHFLLLYIVAGQFSRLFRTDTSIFNGKDIPLDDVIPSEAYMAEQLMEAKSFDEQSKLMAELLFRLNDRSAERKNGRSDLAQSAFQAMINRQGRLSVNELSQELYYSQRYLHTVLNEQIGAVAKTISRNIRMQNAIQLLKNTNLSIEQVGQTLGFYDTAHFIHSYTDFMWESPSDSRKKFLIPKNQESLSKN